MADIRLGYGVTERPQASLSATCSRAVDVGPAVAEGRPPKSVSIAWRIYDLLACPLVKREAAPKDTSIT